MRKSGLNFALLLLLGACKTSDVTDPGITTTVLVSSSPTQITVGETAQASAIVKDQDGNPLSGKTVAWTSLNQSIATVSSSGVIRGESPGSATIQGTVDGITGTAAIQVVATSQVCASGPTTVTLAVGQARVLSAIETQGCIKVAATAEPSTYLVITANTNEVPDALASFTLRSDPGETVPNNTFLTTPRLAVSAVIEKLDPRMSLQAGFETSLRQIERRQLDLPAAQRAYSAGSLQRGQLSVSAAIPALGDKTPFRVPRSCEDFKTVTATVRHISARAIIYTDDASPVGGFTDAEFQVIAKEFDDLIYPTDVDYFGTPLDLDENSRVVILYTPEVNKLTPAGNPGGFVGGFFFAGDLFPSATCPQTNRAEIFYALAPDPAGTINGNVRTVDQVRQGTRGTLAHEFEHMINASERIRHPVTAALEAIWLDEALAHFAEDLNGRVLRGLNETGNYTFDQLTNNGSAVNDFNAFFFQNFARFQRYAQNPGPNSPTSRFSDSSLADRGASWSLLRYAADHHAPGGNIKAFIKSLIPGPDTGVVNLRSKAGNVVFDSLVTAWSVANFTDDAGVAGLATKHTYKTYNMRSNVARVNTPSQEYPLVVTELPANSFTATGLTLRSASARFFRMTRTIGAPARIFRFVNNDLTTSASFPGATMIVVRIQ